jgi:hypothetical protein
LPSATKLIMPMSLRPALLAGVAVVERGPSIIAEPHSRTMGAYYTHFGIIAASMLGSGGPTAESHLCS